MDRRRASLLIFVVALTFSYLGLAWSAFGQAVSGSIFGTVTDPTGAVVPSVTITVQDIDRGLTYHLQTNTDGNYIQTHLLAGRYRVTMESLGFERFVVDANVQVDASTRVDARLVIGKATSTVNVTSQTPLLKTDRVDVSDTLSTSELESLPVLSRNMTGLAAGTPGITIGSQAVAQSENPQGGLTMNANGQDFANNGMLVDGTNNHSPLIGIIVVNPNIDSLQEFKVTTSNYDAEFGSASGALLQATTKSGTNELHGTAFEYLQNNYLNSANPFTGVNPPTRWNQFGGSLGGPIKKNKVFFFADYQAMRQRLGGSIITTVPTVAERGGNLQSLLGNYICADGTDHRGWFGSGPRRDGL